MPREAAAVDKHNVDIARLCCKSHALQNLIDLYCKSGQGGRPFCLPMDKHQHREKQTFTISPQSLW